MRRLLLAHLCFFASVLPALATGAVTGFVVTGSAAGNSDQHAQVTISFTCDAGYSTADLLVYAQNSNQLTNNAPQATAGNFETAYDGLTCGSNLQVWVWAQYEVPSITQHTLAACVTGFDGNCSQPALTTLIEIDPVSYNVSSMSGTLTMVRSAPVKNFQWYALDSSCSQSTQLLSTSPYTTLQWQTSGTTIYNCGPQSYGTWNGSDFPTTFLVTNSCTQPSSETTAWGGWSGTAGLWTQTLNGGSFVSRIVRETNAAAADDTCWWPQSTHDYWGGVTGGVWSVIGSNGWGPDAIGWANGPPPDDDITYYRQQQRVPCGVTMHQQMQISCPGGTYQNYGAPVDLTATITKTKISSGRAGQSKSKVY